MGHETFESAIAERCELIHQTLRTDASELELLVLKWVLAIWLAMFVLFSAGFLGLSILLA